MVLEGIGDIITGSVGFIISMIILSIVIGIGITSYYNYAHTVITQNTLEPVAEVVPYNNSWYLGVVNTGPQPFIITKVYLADGKIISVKTNTLQHDNWWFNKIIPQSNNTLPIAVEVCSALDPTICTEAPVHGWNIDPLYVSSPSSNYITVAVLDPYNDSWTVTCFSQSTPYEYRISQSSSYVWFLNPPVYPANLQCYAWAWPFMQVNGTWLLCTINNTITQSFFWFVLPSSSASGAYMPGSKIIFEVECNNPSQLLNNQQDITVEVTVNDPYNAGWNVTWTTYSWSFWSWSSQTNYEAGTTSMSWTINTTNPIYFNAEITSVPSGYSFCIIAPPMKNVFSSTSIQFSVVCYSSS